MTTKSQPDQLKDVLFDTLRAIKEGDASLDEARTIACTANSICNVVRTEIKVSQYNEEKKETQKNIDF